MVSWLNQQPLVVARYDWDPGEVCQARSESSGDMIEKVRPRVERQCGTGCRAGVIGIYTFIICVGTDMRIHDFMYIHYNIYIYIYTYMHLNLYIIVHTKVNPNLQMSSG